MKLGFTKDLRGKTVLGSMPDEPEGGQKPIVAHKKAGPVKAHPAEEAVEAPAPAVGTTPDRRPGAIGSEERPYPMPERKAKVPAARADVYTSGPYEYSPEKGKYQYRAGTREKGGVIPGITQAEHDRLTGDLKEDLKKGESVLFRAPGGGQYVITKDPFGEIIWDRFSRAHQPGDEPSRKIDYKDYF